MARARERPSERDRASEKEEALHDKSVEALQEIARRNDISGYSELARDDLVELLMTHRLEPATYAAEAEVEPTPEEVYANQQELERRRKLLGERFHGWPKPRR